MSPAAARGVAVSSAEEVGGGSLLSLQRYGDRLFLSQCLVVLSEQENGSDLGARI